MVCKHWFLIVKECFQSSLFYCYLYLLFGIFKETKSNFDLVLDKHLFLPFLVFLSLKSQYVSFCCFLKIICARGHIYWVSDWDCSVAISSFHSCCDRKKTFHQALPERITQSKKRAGNTVFSTKRRTQIFHTVKKCNYSICIFLSL